MVSKWKYLRELYDAPPGDLNSQRMSGLLKASVSRTDISCAPRKAVTKR